MQQTITLAGTSASGNAQQWAHPFVGRAFPNTVAAGRARTEAPAAGTLRNLKVELLSALGGGDAFTFALEVNSSVSALSVTVTDPATTAENTGSSVSIAQGDLLAISITGSGSPVAVVFRLTYEFEGTTASHSLHGFGGPADFPTASGQFVGPLTGDFYFTTTPSDREEFTGVAGTIARMHVRLSTAPGAGTSRSFTLYKNGVAQDGTGGTPNTTVTIADTATGASASFSLTVAQNDTLRCICTTSGGVASSYICGSILYSSTAANIWPVMGLTNANQPSNTAVSYVAYRGSSVPDATESNRYHLGGVTSFQLYGLRVVIVNSPGTSRSWIVTLRVNGVDTTQTVTISDSATSATTVGATVLINEDDDISIKITPTGTPASTAFRWYFFASAGIITGSFVAGVNTTVRVSRSAAFGLNGNINTQDNVGELAIFGNLRVTGSANLSGGLAGTDLDDLTDVVITSPANDHILQHNGSNWINRLFTEHTIEVAISSSEILNLRATPKTLVAAAGAATLLEFVSLVLLLDATATAYAESNDNLAVRYQNTTGPLASEAIEMTGFIDQTADTWIRANPAAQAALTRTATENQPLVLHNTGDGEFTTGTGVLRAEVTYRLWATGW